MGAGLGLLAGVGELAVLAAKRLLVSDFIDASRDAGWMIPAVDAVLLMVAALAVWAAHRLSGARLNWLSATIGTSNSLLNNFMPREIELTSCVRLS